jgi:hypothetical protein
VKISSSAYSKLSTWKAFADKQILWIINNILLNSRLDLCEKFFTNFYRIAYYQADSSLPKQFRDFGIAGQLKCSGNFIKIDSLNDENSIFNEKYIIYFSNGNPELIRNFKRGVLDGDISTITMAKFKKFNIWNAIQSTREKQSHNMYILNEYEAIMWGLIYLKGSLYKFDWGFGKR